VLEAVDWKRPSAADVGNDAVWGRLPAAGLSPLSALLFAVRRERALTALRRGIAGVVPVRRIHRLAPARHAGRIRGVIRGLLLQGAAAELTEAPDAQRAYELVLRESGVRTSAISLRVSRDGSVRVAGELQGDAVIVRMGSMRAGIDPRRATDALRELDERSVHRAPKLLREGCSGQVAWTVESQLAGGVPHRFHDALWADVVGFASALQNAKDQPITAVSRHVEILNMALPNRTEELRDVALSLAMGLRSLPSVLQHGDMCRDNILVEHGSFSGIVDWVTWDPAGVPGVDLIELYATERMRDTRTETGALVRGRVWDEPEFRSRTAPYWQALGISPTPALLQPIGVAWWLMSLATLLDRPDRRYLAKQPDWISRNVDAVVSWLRTNPQ
jgi:hypothetical protein